MSELVFNRVILEKHNRVLTWGLMILLGLNLIFVFWFMRASGQPPLIVFAKDGQLEVLKSRDLKMDEAFLKDFVKMVTGQYLSFSVSSLPKQIEGIKPYLAPKSAETILASFKNNQTVIEKESISQQFVINAIAITKKTDPFWVEVEGTRNIRASGNDKSAAVTYILEIKKIKPSEENPYGLLMTDIIEKGQTK
ncbi:MAG: TraE/TraK family type IV conjugative transfer system protein [Candidatus Omnitrophota bacterium]|nr:TraE/TraK family type IV conjugative transfer system protein [Candidatus Omnitrophota bacterium]